MNILATGGFGYIGSHTVLSLLEAEHKVIIFDNFSNSSIDIAEKMEAISKEKTQFYNADVRDSDALNEIFQNNHIDCIFHFAGLKSVQESTLDPLKYYDNNVSGTINLLKIASNYSVKKIVFSSSATVYGNCPAPCKESVPFDKAFNPYGRTKQIIEHILESTYQSDNEWSIAILRYFNPVGAHESGIIGESPVGIPNNLFPYILDVARGKLEKLFIFGNDYPTPDGTCIRDYIHVMDLAYGHLKAVEYINNKNGVFVWNLGTGNAYSVLQIVDAFKNAINKEIPFVLAARRQGDLPEVWADSSKANLELGWKAQKTILEAIVDSWRFIEQYSK